MNASPSDAGRRRALMVSIILATLAPVTPAVAQFGFPSGTWSPAGLPPVETPRPRESKPAEPAAVPAVPATEPPTPAATTPPSATPPPPTTPSSAPSPVTAPAAPPTPPAAAASTAAAAARPAPESLDAGAAARAGLIDAGSGGLPAAMWRGTTMAEAKRLVAALPMAPSSRVLRDLKFRLLASRVAPPSGAAPGESLYEARLRGLAAMGEAESANEMSRAAAGRESEPVARLLTDSLLLAGHRASACARIASYGPAGGAAATDTYWSDAAALCRLLQGDPAGARAAAEARPSADPAFAALLEAALSGGRATRAGPANALNVVLLEIQKLAPVAGADAPTPGLLRALVDNPAVPLARRVALAEAGEAAGVVEPETLARLYEALAREQPAAGRATLHVAVRDARGDAAVAQALAAMFAQARGQDAFAGLVRASGPRIAALPVAPAQIAVVGEGLRAALIAADYPRARAWLDLAFAESARDARAVDALERLLPVATLADLDPRATLDESRLARWLELAQADDPARAPGRAMALAGALRALGHPAAAAIPPGAARGVVAAPDALRAMEAAAAAGRAGETVANLLVAIGATPLSRADPDAIARGIAALRAVGLASFARALAVEHVLATGV